MIRYNCILPSVNLTGPTIIAMQICEYMKNCGYDVRVYSMDRPSVKVVSEFPIKHLTLFDFLEIRGVFHSHTFRPDLFAAFLALVRGGRVRTLTTVHSYFYDALLLDYARWKVKYAYWLWKIAISKLTRVVFISESMRRYYKIRGLKVRQTAVINNWRQKMSEPYSNIKPAHAVGVNLIFCGSLDDRKNVLPLIERVRYLKRPVRLTIIGAGKYAENISEISKESETIEYVGRQNDISRFLTTADVLVLPSKAEGLPTVVLEAMQYGVPSLLSNIAVHRELEKIGVGVTFDHLNFTGLVESLDACLKLDRKKIRGIWEKRFSGIQSGIRYERCVKEVNFGL